jgi:O-antigen ligase
VAMLLLQLGTRGKKAIAAVTLLLLCVGTYYSATRSCQLSLAVIALLGAVLPGPSRSAYRVLVGGLLVGAVVGYAAGGTPVARLGKLSPVETRLNLLVAAAEIMFAHPWRGSGYGSFVMLNEEYYNRAAQFGALSYQERWYQVGSHNTLVTPLAEMGFVLGGLYVWLVLRPLVLALWRNRAGSGPAQSAEVRGVLICALLVCVVFVVNGLLVEFRWALTPNALFWVFAALIERHHALRKQSQAESQRTRRATPATTATS